VQNQILLFVLLKRQKKEEEFQLCYKESNTKLLLAITKIPMEICWCDCEFWCFACCAQNDM